MQGQDLAATMPTDPATFAGYLLGSLGLPAAPLVAAECPPRDPIRSQALSAALSDQLETVGPTQCLAPSVVRVAMASHATRGSAIARLRLMPSGGGRGLT